MKIFTIEDIRSWRPCYNPNKYITEDFKGTVLDILNLSGVPVKDRLWAVLREECIDAGLLRRFAAWCAAEALFLAKIEDIRSWDAVKVAVRYSLGEASKKELAAAEHAAWNAAEYVAWAAARAEHSAEYLAWAAARAEHSAKYAAWAAAEHSAEYATWAVAWAGDSAGAAAWAAAGDAAGDAAAAWNAAWNAQITKLISMLKGESNFTLSNILNDYPIRQDV